MSDQFSETSSESWFGRIGDSIKGFLFGLVLIPAAVVLLSWNEGRTVTTAKSLAEGLAAVVSIEPGTIAPANDQKLIHVSGDATTSDVVSDPLFALSAPALRLARKVEIYQWKEREESSTQKKLGGGTETTKTYKYEKTWADAPISSAQFKLAEEHRNTGEKLAPDETFPAPHVTLGAFKVPPSVLAKMSGDEPLTPTDADLAKLKPDWQGKAKLADSGFYFGTDPTAPAIGDQRVTFKALKPAVFSVVAQQSGDTFAPYHTKAGRDLERVESGTVDAAGMFAHAASENALITWILRAAGFVAMSLGIGMILSPISVLADVIPFLGSLLGAGVFLAALFLGAAGSLVTIAVAWFVVRPVLSIVLVVLALGGLWLGRQMGAGKRPAPAAAV
jgi:hypothetical protein